MGELQEGPGRGRGGYDVAILLSGDYSIATAHSAGPGYGLYVVNALP